ncbi:MAG: hypothetical protein JNG85_02090, partial [Spirochaetaceae bacterium]|nr:hypothetical protein [Spirochaetaceae bacterium]
MNKRGRGAARLFAVAVFLPILAFPQFSCSTAPPPPSAGASAAGAATGAGGTTLKTAEPSALSRSQDERRAIELAIVAGAPSSLARSFGLIGEARALKLEDARLLAWIGARVAALVYPEGAEAFVPADLRGQAEIPSSPLARSLADAAAGRSPAPSPELEGNPLAELIPALVAFRSESRESARRAAEALDRFEKLGSPSVLPALIRGLDAERLQERGRALTQYDLAIVAAPDCWPAAVGAARVLLALRRPEEALARLDAAEKAAGPAVGAYATFRKARAETLYESGRLAEAEPLVLGILREDPLDSRFVLARAHLLVRAKSYQQAIPLLDAYATVDPANRRLLVLRALAA